jgi:hypothetical protein
LRNNIYILNISFGATNEKRKRYTEKTGDEREREREREEEGGGEGRRKERRGEERRGEERRGEERREVGRGKRSEQDSSFLGPYEAHYSPDSSTTTAGK